MQLTRRAFLAGSAAALAGCHDKRTAPMPNLVHRPLASLPQTTLPWLSLRDHFVATVGPQAGQGRPLGPCLVLADATFAPHSRFPLHPHEEMEILSVVLDGTLSHHGDQAHGATLGPRSAQLISARSGMRHAEGNDTDEPTRMLQIWFRPDTHGGAPAYFSRTLYGEGRQRIAGDEGMPLRANVQVWWLPLYPAKREPLVVQRRGYLLAATGALRIAAPDGHPALDLALGDGVEIGAGEVALTTEAACAAVWIELP